MSKYKNYIYLSICETSFELFKKSNFVTYFNYCGIMKMSLNDGRLSGKQKHDIEVIGKMLAKIYGLTDSNIGLYVSNFFNLNNIHDFEVAVRLMENYREVSPQPYQ